MATRKPSTADERPELEVLECADQAAWEAWLGRHQERPGVWLKIAKKNTGTATVSQPEAIESAICQGWIDGQVRRLDETYFLQRFTPRGPRSKWSQINRDKANRLIADGRMQPAGLTQVQAAQSDGRWEAAYEPQSRATIPPDFQHALEANPAAQEFFATLTGSRRYAFLYRLHHVRSPARRAQRIADYIDRLSQGRALD